MDRIVIENVEVYARHGVFPEETRLGQRFYVNAVLYLDTRRAGISDELEHSTNYGEVCCLISDFLQEYTYKLLEAAAGHLAEQAGIAEDKIILDPGVGFGKTYEQNLEVIRCLEELHMFGYPLLLGTSRKSVIGNTLNLPVDDRVEGTIATSVIGVMKGCSFVRVHDVKENVRAVMMAEAILHGGK